MKNIFPLFISVLITYSVAHAQPQKQNIVFFLVDDLGWTDVEPFGTSFYETPNIKKLAQESMIFTNAYAACPVCSPTRASILTGKYPVATGLTNFIEAERTQPVQWSRNTPIIPPTNKDRLSLDEITLAEALKTAGYKTFFTGKWHLGPEGFWPENQGFDFNLGGHHAGQPKSYFSPYKNPRLSDGPEGEHLPDRLAQETVKFISSNKGNPFFVYFSFYSVHTPLKARKDLVDKYEEKKVRLNLQDTFSREGDRKLRIVQSHTTYAAMVEAMDEAVGKVIRGLKEQGVYDRTMIVFFSDNGGLSTSEGHPTANLPLRAGKGWLYEGGIRVPLIIKWPGITSAGSICQVPVISNDFFPTFMNAAGVPTHTGQHTGGVNMLPLLMGKTNQKRALFWHYPHYSNQGGSPGSAIREGDWKLIRWHETGKEELYNLKQDIGEKNDLFVRDVKIARKLSSKLDDWLKNEHAVLPQKNPKFVR
jgi:arylsulfatase A-like enzyme